jgi:hypothetical protein
LAQGLEYTRIVLLQELGCSITSGVSITLFPIKDYYEKECGMRREVSSTARFASCSQRTPAFGKRLRERSVKPGK